MILLQIFLMVILIAAVLGACAGLIIVILGLIHALFFHKPIFEEYEIVLAYGVEGVIVHIYDNHAAYEIEVFKNDKTIAVKTVKAEYVKKIVKI